MSYLNPRIERLKELLDLEEKRSGVLGQLESIVQRINSIRDTLYEGESAVTAAPKAPAAAPKAAATAAVKAAPVAVGGKRKRMKRGALKAQILEALSAAGSAGIRVTELAKELAIKPVNIHSWFHSAITRIPQIKKIQGGHYRLDGAVSAKPAKAPKAPKAPKAAKVVKAAATPAPARKAKGGKKSTAPHSRRGELSARILAELGKAGAKGILVKDLADRVGAPYKNIYIWFATTGKKNPKIKKVAPAHYKLNA